MVFTVGIQQQGRLFREGISRYLRADPMIRIAGEAVTDEALMHLCRDTEPDLVVLEADAGDWDPCRLAARLQSRAPGLRFVGTHRDSTDEVRLERVNRCGITPLVPHVRGCPGVLRAIRESLEAPVPRVRLLEPGSGRPAWLTMREVAILRLIAAGRSCREVAAQLAISNKTVENHKQRIFRKLDVQNQSQAVASALRLGLIQSADGFDVVDTPATPAQRQMRRAVTHVDVIIADEDNLEGDILASACEDTGVSVTAVVQTVDELLEASARLTPQIVVASDHFGVGSIGWLVPRILASGSRVIVMSRDHSPERLTALLTLGVHGVMSHEVTLDEAISGIRAVARGAAAMDHTASALLLRQWRGLRTRLQSRADLGLGILTHRELDVLNAMVRGMATKSIARELGVAVKTVENHKTRVFEKLGVRTQAEAVTVAITFGLGEPDGIGAQPVALHSSQEGTVQPPVGRRAYS